MSVLGGARHESTFVQQPKRTRPATDSDVDDIFGSDDDDAVDGFASMINGALGQAAVYAAAAKGGDGVGGGGRPAAKKIRGGKSEEQIALHKAEADARKAAKVEEAVKWITPLVLLDMLLSLPPSLQTLSEETKPGVRSKLRVKKGSKKVGKLTEGSLYANAGEVARLRDWLQIEAEAERRRRVCGGDVCAATVW